MDRIGCCTSFIFPGQESVWRIVKNKLRVFVLYRTTNNLLVIDLYFEVDLVQF